MTGVGLLKFHEVLYGTDLVKRMTTRQEYKNYKNRYNVNVLQS